MTRSIREKASGPKHSDGKGHILDPCKTTKRSGAGKGNWGSPLDDIDDIDTGYGSYKYSRSPSFGNAHGGSGSGAMGGGHSMSSSVSSNASSNNGNAAAGQMATSPHAQGNGFNLMKARRRSNSQSQSIDRSKMITRFEAEEPMLDEI